MGKRTFFICAFLFSWTCSLFEDYAEVIYNDFVDISIDPSECNGWGTRKNIFIPQGDFSGNTNTAIIQDRTHVIEITGMLNVLLLVINYIYMIVSCINSVNLDEYVFF